MSMDKKLQREYERGLAEGRKQAVTLSEQQLKATIDKELSESFRQGAGFGGAAVQDVWFKIITETKGIGPVLRERIIQAAQDKMLELRNKREDKLTKKKEGTDHVA